MHDELCAPYKVHTHWITHLMRTTAAKLMAERGTSFDIIKVMGRWDPSVMTLAYIAKNPAAALPVSNLPTHRHWLTALVHYDQATWHVANWHVVCPRTNKRWQTPPHPLSAPRSLPGWRISCRPYLTGQCACMFAIHGMLTVSGLKPSCKQCVHNNRIQT